MAIVYPATITTDAERMAYLIRYRQEWLLLFNKLGKWFKTGITQTEYDALPLNVRSRVNYTPQITQAQWDYAKTSMKTARAAFVGDIQVIQQRLENSTTYNPDPTDLFTPAPAPVV